MNSLILCAVIGIATAASLSSETTPLLPQTIVINGALEHENANTIENTEPQDTHWLLERIYRMPQDIANRIPESVSTAYEQLREEGRFMSDFTQTRWRIRQTNNRLLDIAIEFRVKFEVLYSIRPSRSWSVLKKD